MKTWPWFWWSIIKQYRVLKKSTKVESYNLQSFNHLYCSLTRMMPRKSRGFQCRSCLYYGPLLSIECIKYSHIVLGFCKISPSILSTACMIYIWIWTCVRRLNVYKMFQIIPQKVATGSHILVPRRHAKWPAFPIQRLGYFWSKNWNMRAEKYGGAPSCYKRVSSWFSQSFGNA